LCIVLATSFFVFSEEAGATNTNGITAEVYNVLGQNGSPYIPQGASPVVTTTVPNIDFQWGLGSVLGGPSEDVIVRFTGSIRSDSTQDISFLATADDGTKLYIDGVLVANDWVDKGGGGTTTEPISFTAGVPKTIELMYYENGGGANVKLYWNQSGSMQIIPAEAFTSQAAPVVKTIGPPRNLTISSNETSTVLVWEAPDTGNTQPERYAISFNCTGCNGWGIATGNVGGPNSLNTTITIDHSLLNGLMPAGTVWSFHIRSDNDTFALYSTNSNVVTGSTYVAPVPEPSPTPTPSPSETTTVTTPTPETVTVTTPTPETATVTIPSETTTVTTPAVPTGPVTVAPTGPTEAEIAAQVAAQAAAQQAEAARIQAETAALIAQQAAAAQAEANRLAEIAAANAEANRIAAELAAKVAEEEAAMAEEAARIQAEIDANAEADRIAADLAALEAEMEAEAQAEADRIAQEEAEAQEEANAKAEEERLAAEKEAMEQEIANALAEEEAAIAEEEAEIAEELAAIKEEEEKVVEEIEKAVESGKELTEEQKDVVVAALIEDLKPGESISAAQVQASGVSYADLPPETPIEVRTSESGEVLVITAEVAANIELVQDPGALIEAVFNDPGAALAAIGSIGADMTESEREEATDMVVATVVATGAAINAAAVAAGGAAGGSSGGGSSGGGSGSNSPGSRGGRKW
jgi:hypothetical protein